MKIKNKKACITCCHINSTINKSLPFFCPETGIHCLAIDIDRKDRRGLEAIYKFVKKISNSECNMKDAEVLRVPMNKEFMHPEFLKEMEKMYKEEGDALPKIHH